MKWLVKLYPPRWRARYEEEFLAVLGDRRLSVRDVIDVVVAAGRTRWNPRFRDSLEAVKPRSVFSRERRGMLPDNMADMDLERELYRVRSNNTKRF